MKLTIILLHRTNQLVELTRSLRYQGLSQTYPLNHEHTFPRAFKDAL